MSEINEKNCRLCLQMLDDDYNVIGESTRDIFETLLLNVDLSVSEEPVVCKSCMESTKEAYDFKSTCIAVEKQVVSLVIDRNSAELDIRDVYLNENENKSLVFNEDYNICRFCLKCLEKSNFNVLNDLRKNFADNMLLKCIPELDLNIIKDPVVCTACIKSLESYYSFAIKCWNTEKNIVKYCEVQGAEYNEQISLSNVLKFLIECMPEFIDNHSKMDAFKGEYDLVQSEGDTYYDINNITLKVEAEEEHIIKDEYKLVECKVEETNCNETEWKDVVTYNKYQTHTDSPVKQMLIHKNNSEGTTYKCDLCSYEGKRKNYLTNHMLKHKDASEVVMFRCVLCTFETKRKTALSKHILVHKDNSEVTMYKCNSCNYETKRKNYLGIHMLTHKDSSEVIMYKCSKCTFETKHKLYLKNHMLIHKNKAEMTTYKCNLCNYEGKQKGYLQKHMLTHKGFSDVVMFRCTLCTFETKLKSGLNQHMIVHRNNSEVTMKKCNLCNYETKWAYSLKSHMLTHKDSSDIVMYRCSLCTFETKRKTGLNQHMLVHRDNSEVTMYKCNLCNHETKWAQGLKLHMLTHKDSSEIVMYRCEMCNFKTKHNRSFRRHMRIHKDAPQLIMYKDSVEVANI